MADLIIGENEFDSYYKLLNLILLKGNKSSRYKELLNCLMSIKYNESDFNKFMLFKDIYLGAVGKTAIACWLRAERVYTTHIDRMTKPSYLKRLKDYSDILNNEIIQINQLDNIIHELSYKPKYSLLTFTFFRPADLIDKKRPGYVPCPIAGDFKFRNGELSLNVFFRSHDALNFGFADIYFLRLIQSEVLLKAKSITTHPSLKRGKIGTLNFHFSRVYLPLRMEMKKKEYINGYETNELCLNLICELENFAKCVN